MKSPKPNQTLCEVLAPSEYLAMIGSIGGKKSRRKLSKAEASRIAKLRWAKNKSPDHF